MKLSIKLFGIILFTSLILLLILNVFSKIFLLKNFTEIEIQNAHKDTKVVLNYIQRDLSNLDSITVDYARWDDTYNYINNRNEDYISNNFSYTTSIARSNVSFIFIIDEMGKIVYKANIEDETKIIFTEALAKNITSSVYKLLSDKNTKSVIGIIMSDKTPILIAAERITKNDGTGNKSGVFIFANYYDEDQIAAINKNTKVKSKLLPYDKNVILKSYSENDITYVKITNDKFIDGYGIIKDIFSKPALLVRVTLERDVFRKAENVINLYLLVLIMGSILFSLIIITLIHVFVVKRINTIKSIVGNIENSHDLSEIIILNGKDEISQLGYEFNRMFHRLKESDATIFTLAYYDSLTGLLNRKKLLENVNGLLEKGKENFAFLFIDLDNFKSINDNFGHEAGDKVLQEVALRLKNNTRSNDIVSRIGGDEFIVIVRNINSLSSAVEIGDKIVSVLGATIIYNEDLLYIGASVGISLFPEHGTDVDTLIKNADLAMYEVKNNGGYGYSIYNNIMNENAIDKQKMKKNLINAVAKNEFITYYQPIIDLKLMKILSAESLIRWEIDSEIVMPIEFIPIAKKIGEIVRIDNWMLNNACGQCKKWQELGVKDFSVSVNASYKQLIQLNFVELVMDILNSQLLEPGYLNLEITEDEAMEDIDLIMEVLSELKSKGVKISMDDFGTGYSSLSYISKLPIDTIKIDKSLITNLENDSRSIVIVKTIIVMAHSLNIEVVAEGIETETQFEKLKELECDYIQGYLIGKPMPAADFQERFI